MRGDQSFATVECTLNSSDPLSCCKCRSCFMVDAHTCTKAVRWGCSEKVEAFGSEGGERQRYNSIFTLLRQLSCLRTNFPYEISMIYH